MMSRRARTTREVCLLFRLINTSCLDTLLSHGTYYLPFIFVFDYQILIIHAGPSSRGTKDFSQMLYHAAFNDSDSKKVVPLFAEAGTNGGPTLRISTMQHMTITHLRRKKAVLAADMMSSKTATETQMDRVQTTLKEYGMT